jgi:uridine kinase
MFSKEVSINITGRAKTGKSTIARVVKKALEDNGFSVDLSDPDAPVSDEFFDRCLDAVKGQNIKIHINSTNVSR